jgi:hypothetical protein
MTELRDIDGNGFTPDPEPVLMLMCGCCQRLRTKPEDVAMFGTLTDAGGKQWRICGKCISAMWRKRAPKLEPLV